MIKFGMAPHAYVEGWTWMAGAGFLTLVTPAYLKGNKIIFFLSFSSTSSCGPSWASTWARSTPQSASRLSAGS